MYARHVSKPIRTVLVAGVDGAVAERFEAALRGANFDVDHVPNARAAVDLIRMIGFDVLVLGYPPTGPSMDELMDLIRGASSPCLKSAVLLVAPAGRLAEVEAYSRRGCTRLVPADLGDAELQHEVGALLRVSPRRAVRVTVRLQVQLADGRTELMSQTENVSATGFLVRTTRPHPVETPVRFELYLPADPAPVSGRGVVVRHATDRADRVTGLGVKFTAFLPGSDIRLQDFLARQ